MTWHQQIIYCCLFHEKHSFANIFHFKQLIICKLKFETLNIKYTDWHRHRYTIKAQMFNNKRKHPDFIHERMAFTQNHKFAKLLVRTMFMTYCSSFMWSNRSIEMEKLIKCLSAFHSFLWIIFLLFFSVFFSFHIFAFIYAMEAMTMHAICASVSVILFSSSILSTMNWMIMFSQFQNSE